MARARKRAKKATAAAKKAGSAPEPVAPPAPEPMVPLPTAPPEPASERGGRPTKYEERFCEMLIEFMKEGPSFEAFAAEIGVHRDTLYEWAKVHERFSDAKKRGTDAGLLFWERRGIDLARLGGGNATVWVFTMKNRFGYTDKREVSHSGDPTKPVAVSVDTMSREERLRLIEEKRAKLDELARRRTAAATTAAAVVAEAEAEPEADDDGGTDDA